MKNKKVLAAGLAFCVSLQGLVSCAEEERLETVRAQIGVACYDQDDIFISELLDCVEEELGLLEDHSFQATVTVRDGAGSQKIYAVNSEGVCRPEHCAHVSRILYILKNYTVPHKSFGFFPYFAGKNYVLGCFQR